ncbi:MAG: hypothetical protein HYZ28_06800, partial [Myxococcales bacterium]|nr:hypothetical protein [Myxococcales bacterium]
LVPAPLSENKRYYWRARAFDGTAAGDWATSSFMVDVANDPPAAPTLLNPSDGSGDSGLELIFTLVNATDPEGDPLSYTFELYDDASLASAPVGTEAVPEGKSVTSWKGPTLAAGATYYWRARASDGRVSGPFSAAARFATRAVSAAPARGGCGCGAGGGLALAGLLLLAGLGRKRSRR